MAYHIYTTPSIILSDRPLGEANKSFNILTRELGLIRATAQGVRLEASKLRGALLPFLLTNISVVKGKGDWRITNVSIVESLVINLNKEELKAFARAMSLLEKLVQGEEKHPDLFDGVVSMVRLGEKGELGKDEIALWEAVMVARILFHLGYLSKEDVPKELFDDIDVELIRGLMKDKKEIVEVVNRGIRTSGLI